MEPGLADIDAAHERHADEAPNAFSRRIYALKSNLIANLIFAHNNSPHIPMGVKKKRLADFANKLGKADLANRATLRRYWLAWKKLEQEDRVLRPRGW